MKLKTKFTLKEVCGMYVAVGIGGRGDDSNSVIRFNETGKLIFELIQEGKEEDDIVASLKGEYDATDEILHSEVRNVIKQLQDEGLLV